MYGACAQCGQADCQCGYLGFYKSRSWLKWLLLALCCCLLVAAILGVVLGLIPVYLDDDYDRTFTRNFVPPNGIPNDGVTALSDPVDVTLSRTIRTSTQIIVTLDILHANTAELIVSLISPDGTSVILHNATPGTNLITTFPTFRAPAQSLNAFNNRRTNGLWRLRILDNNGAVNAGQLRQWSVRFLKD